MAISPRYENFSFVGSKEDLFTKYKRKCTTVRQKRSKFITTGVVLFLLVALVIGLSIGLHVTKSAEKVESSAEADTSKNSHVEIYDENNTAQMNGKLSSALLVTVPLDKDKTAGKQQAQHYEMSTPCPDESQCL